MSKSNNNKIPLILAILSVFVVSSFVAFQTMEKPEELAVGGGPGTINQLSPWRTADGAVQLSSSTADLLIPSLTNCDTIDTDGNGRFECGTDGGGGGSGGGLATTTPWTAGQLTQVTDNGTVNSIATSSLGLPTFADLSGYITGIDWGQIGGTLSDQTDLQSALDGKQATLTTGNLTENIAGLEFDATRSVIGGSAALSLSSGYVIPLSASTTEWATAYSWGNHASAGYLTNLSSFDTDDLTQGATNLYNQTHTGEVTGATALTIADNIIEEANLEATNSPTDNYILSFDNASGGFTWVQDATGGSPVWGTITGTLSDQTDLQTALDAKLSTTTAASTYYLASNPSGYTTNTGTVTSVGMTVPTGLSISGSPVTTSGTLAITLTSGYTIPLSASTTEWTNFYNSPSNRITAGNNLTWSGNTLNLDATLTGITDITGDATGLDINTATNGNITIDPGGAGVLNLNAGSGGLNITTDAGNSDITLNPHGTGTVVLTDLTSALLNTDASGNVGEYAGTSCTNQFVRSLSALGVSTCATVDMSSDTNLSVTATGLTYSTDTISLTSGYVIPLSASTTEWSSFFNTPSSRITAGTGLSWTGNTLNSTTTPAGSTGQLQYNNNGSLGASTIVATSTYYTNKTLQASQMAIVGDANNYYTSFAAGSDEGVLMMARDNTSASGVQNQLYFDMFTPGAYYLYNGSSTLARYGQLNFGGLTANRTFTFPNVTGTVALLENAQTFSGLKTFSASPHSAVFNNEVGIGTSAPDGPLDVHGAGVPIIINSTGSNGLKLQWEDNSSITGYLGSSNILGYSFYVGNSSAGTQMAITDSGGHVIPGSDNSQDLGSASLHWSCLYYDASNIGTCSSDSRLKHNINDLSLADRPLDSIVALRPRTFEWNENPGVKNYGLIAQEVQEVAPELVEEGDDGFLKVKYGYLQYLIIDAIKELFNWNMWQDSRIEKLEAENADLKARLERLEAKENVI